MKQPDSFIDINGQLIGFDHPTYFIADIAANHDGDLSRAIELIHLAAKAGANAAKFQHFKAETIVSDVGFKGLPANNSHQSKWKKSVFNVYKDASVSGEWTPYLVEACRSVGIAFLTSPYDLSIVDAMDSFLPAYKIGSGDITWIEIVEHIASKNKPYLIASGASSLEDIIRAVTAGLRINSKLCLMQCNTNYTASLENFRFINLNVLKTFKALFPGLILGLSDHTPGCSTVLGAIALGARVVEKHFTDDQQREGPDHAFSMSPGEWAEMVSRSRELEFALGSGLKKVEDNELETVQLQRRAVYLIKDIIAGESVRQEYLTLLRPSPPGSIPPYLINECIGRVARRNLSKGDRLNWTDLE